jgi:hypothetical protein
MITINVKPGNVIQTGDYPPRFVFAGFFNGRGTILYLDRPEDDIDDAIRQAAHIQKVENAKRVSGRRLKRLEDSGQKE